MNIIRLAIDRPIFILMVTAFIVVIGGLALKHLPVDLYPDVSYPVLSVRATLPGAAPEEMEELVTKPIEDALASLAGVTTIRSRSSEELTAVTLEFDPGVDINGMGMNVSAHADFGHGLPSDMNNMMGTHQTTMMPVGMDQIGRASHRERA